MTAGNVPPRATQLSANRHPGCEIAFDIARDVEPLVQAGIGRERGSQRTADSPGAGGWNARRDRSASNPCSPLCGRRRNAEAE